jgi:hypothetical protein
MTTIQEVELHLKIKPFQHLERYRRFNNSLIHLKDNYYLMTYRMFYPETIRKSNYTLPSRKFHPWSSQWRSKIDATVIAVLKFENRRFVTLREMMLEYPEHLSVFDDNLQDARIVRLQDKFYVYGQAWIEPYYPLADTIREEAEDESNVTTCLKDRNCAAVVTLFQHVEFQMHDQDGLPYKALIKSVQIPCIKRPEINRIHNGMAIEKNWCFFESQGQKFFQYTLHPHIVISMDCKQKYETPSPLQAIKSHFKCGMFFSPGGPLMPWKKGQLLGCGHMKYTWNCLKLLNIPREKFLHPEGWGGYVYCLFFYVIENTPPFHIVSYSHGYIPEFQGQNYALVFPMGCIPLPKQQWAISMGNGDDTSNIMIVHQKDIQKKLIPANFPFNPSTYTVTWWNTDKI